MTMRLDRVINMNPTLVDCENCGHPSPSPKYHLGKYGWRCGAICKTCVSAKED